MLGGRGPDRWHLLIAILLVVSTAVFAAGTLGERASRTGHEAQRGGAAVSESHAGETAGATSREASESEAPGADADAAARREASEQHGEAVLGIDLESPGLVALAVLVSLALAALALRGPAPWLLAAIIAFMVVFVALDAREVAHQAQDSRTGLALIAALALLLHLAVAGVAGWLVLVRGQHGAGRTVEVH